MKILRILLCAGLLAFAGNPAKALAADYDSLRIDTWSVYLQGGMSWAGGVGMKNVNAPTGTNVSPLIGLGVNYNIRPWVRLGLNYEFSRFAREQRFGEFQPLPPKLNPSSTPTEQYGGTAFRNRWSRYHNIDLTAEFNIMELWKKRRDKRFNLYLGTGVGGMFARGNSYDIAMGHERWSDPDNYENSLQLGNDHQLHTWMTAGNSRHNFSSVYIPVMLSAEFDVNPRWTLGVRGGGKFLFSSNVFAPSNVWSAAVVVRYNFGACKRGYKSNKRRLAEMTADYHDLLATYSRDQADCRKSREAAAADSQAQQSRLKALEERNKQLEQELNRQRQQHREPSKTDEFSVRFRRNSFRLSAREEGRLLQYIETAQQKNSDMLVVTAEASADGQSEYNQFLSERRLASVLDLLHKNGIGSERIKTAKAIGDSAQIDDPEARRVTIKTE